MERAFLYGDLVFETIRIEQGRAVFELEHFKRLKQSCSLLQFDSDWLNEDSFHADISNIVNSLLHDHSYRLRYMVYRKSSGLYTPDSNACERIIQYQEIASKESKPIARLGVYTDNRKAHSHLSNLKSGNALVSVLAGIQARERGFDDLIILNDSGRISETIASNMYLVKQGKIFTPKLSEACIDGVYRSKLMEVLMNRGIQIQEEELELSELEDADEVFTSNCIQGIRSVLQYESKSYETIVTGHLQLIMAENGI